MIYKLRVLLLDLLLGLEVVRGDCAIQNSGGVIWWNTENRERLRA
jgi:hypothetical protein